MFVESFQGQYKDGTNGTRDFRMVSALFLLLRIMVLSSFFNFILWILAGQHFVLICATCFYAVVRPYKKNLGNNVDVLILAMLEGSAILLLLAVYSPLTSTTLSYYLLVVVLILGVPHMILILYICCKLAKTLGITECLKRNSRHLKRCVLAIRLPTQAVEAETNNSSLPDRLVNPEEYEPLLLTTEEYTAAETMVTKDLVNKEPRSMNPPYTYDSIS